MENEKYTITVYEEKVEITGTLTIREAFDFLNFFDQQGYTTLEDWGERTTLFFRKRDIEKEKTERINKETLEDLNFVKELYENEKLKSSELNEKVKNLESLIRSLITEESEKLKMLKIKNDRLEKFETLKRLKDDPEVAKICAMQEPIGEEISPFSPLADGKRADE